MKQQVNLEIMQFVETQILPKYVAFGESHGLRHVNRVIKNALKLAIQEPSTISQVARYSKQTLDSNVGSAPNKSKS